MFYIQVIIILKVQSSQKGLLPGEPNLAPSAAVTVEALICFVRKLHTSSSWTDMVSYHDKYKFSFTGCIYLR